MEKISVWGGFLRQTDDWYSLVAESTEAWSLRTHTVASGALLTGHTTQGFELRSSESSTNSLAGRLRVLQY